MKKLLLILFILLTSFQAQAQDFVSCMDSDKLGPLPVLSGGRVKPLSVVAHEAMKFMTGKSSGFAGRFDAVQAYCHLSTAQTQQEKNWGLIMNDLPLKIEHIENKEYFELSPDSHTIPVNLVLDKLAELQTIINSRDAKKEKSTSLDDLKRVYQRASLFAEITTGNHWTLPILIPNKDSGEVKAEWISLTELLQVMEGKLRVGTDVVTALHRAGNLYTKNISAEHLTEHRFFQLKLFHWAMLVVIFALILGFVSKKERSLYALLLTFGVLGIELTAIVFRISISGRGPVTNMYETVMWVGFGSLIFATILYFVRKEKLFLLVGLFLNLACLFMMNFANSMLDSSIQPLVPVLRDNFWLSTHVTSITISYAALALSWMIANVYMIRSIFKPLDSKETNRYSKLAYDAIKIGVVLLAAGIILGGVWADYSWGRFWGWDPKETWSLIALLIYMAILHGRYTKWIPNHRFLPAVGLAFLSIVMAWFGVNYILATGLHSYGFSNGGAIFIGSLSAVQLLIFVIYLFRSSSKK